jgi:hypothetical protein
MMADQISKASPKTEKVASWNGTEYWCSFSIKPGEILNVLLPLIRSQTAQFSTKPQN